MRWWVFILFASGICLAIGVAVDQYFFSAKAPSVIKAPISDGDKPVVDETVPLQKDVDSYSVPPAHPRYIDIPALDIARSRVQPLGLTKKNALDTPRNLSDSGWYTKSSYPGQGSGVVMIDGHSGGLSRNGVFVNLDKLQNGDAITIERGDGKRFAYRVVERRSESLAETNATGMARLFQPYEPTKEGLSLITCGGNWNPRQQVFDKRILVRAVAE